MSRKSGPCRQAGNGESQKMPSSSRLTAPRSFAAPMASVCIAGARRSSHCWSSSRCALIFRLRPFSSIRGSGAGSSASRDNTASKACTRAAALVPKTSASGSGRASPVSDSKALAAAFASRICRPAPSTSTASFSPSTKSRRLAVNEEWSREVLMPRAQGSSPRDAAPSVRSGRSPRVGGEAHSRCAAAASARSRLRFISDWLISSRSAQSRMSNNASDSTALTSSQ